jgi:hypothetical protein
MSSRSAIAFLSGLLTLTLVACGGGGGGGGNSPSPPPPPPPPPDVIVGGLIEAPNGQIASTWPLHGLDRWLTLVVPEAAASVPGAIPVPDGTPVDLNRLDADGSIVETIASTTTTGGRYSFNFTDLGLAFNDYYVATAVGGAGIVLRTFVTSEIADVDVESETTVDLVLESVTLGAGTTLNNFTLQELSDLMAATRLVIMLSDVTADIDIPATVAAVKAALSSDPGFVTLLVSAEVPGQTEVGPGDIGTFFPLDDGLSWTFDGTVDVEGITDTYSSTVKVEGTRDVSGTTATVLAATDTSGARFETLLVKTEQGLSDWTNVPAGGPVLDLLRFPPTTGAAIVDENTRTDIGEDLDGDGVTETVTGDISSTVVGFEDVNVPGGNFSNALRVENAISFTGNLSGGGGSFSGSALANTWFAPGVGQVRADAELTATANGQTVTGRVLEELTGGAFPIAINIRNTDDALGAIPSAGDGYLVFACDAVKTPEGFYNTLVPGSGRVGRSMFMGDVHYLGGCQPESAAAAYDGSNHLFVWAKTDNVNNTNIVAVRVNDDGVPLDMNEFFVSSGSSNFSPAVAFDGSNFLVVWNKFDLSGTGGHEIYGARIAPDGTNLGEFPIFTSPGEQVFPDVAFDGTNYLVVWRDTRSGSGPTDDTDVYGVRVSPAGTVLDTPEIAIVTAPRTQGEPKVASSGTNWLVVWNDIGQLGTSPPPDGRIFGKRVAADGSLLDGPASADGIAIGTAAVPNYGAVVGFVGSDYFVAWGVGSYPSFGTAGIFGASVSTDGVRDGAPDSLGTAISGEPLASSWYVQPRIASRGDEALVTWIKRGPNVDVMGVIVRP